MKKFKRIITMCLALVLCLSCVPAAFAAEVADATIDQSRKGFRERCCEKNETNCMVADDGGAAVCLQSGRGGWGNSCISGAEKYRAHCNPSAHGRAHPDAAARPEDYRALVPTEEGGDDRTSAPIPGRDHRGAD